MPYAQQILDDSMNMQMSYESLTDRNKASEIVVLKMSFSLIDLQIRKMKFKKFSPKPVFISMPLRN